MVILLEVLVLLFLSIWFVILFQPLLGHQFLLKPGAEKLESARKEFAAMEWKLHVLFNKLTLGQPSTHGSETWLLLVPLQRLSLFKHYLIDTLSPTLLILSLASTVVLFLPSQI